MTDHDMLIQLCEKVDLIYVLLTNHLEHHARYTMALLVALIGTTTAIGLQFWRSRSDTLQKKATQKE